TLKAWVDANREKLRARAAILRAKVDWEEKGRRDDMLLPPGLQLERARSLLADPGDITTDEIREFISLSSAREEAEHKQREEALARDEAQVAEINAAQARTAAAQARTASLQRITRLTFAAVGAVILMASATVGYLQWGKARQLARQELALAHAQTKILSEL